MPQPMPRPQKTPSPATRAFAEYLARAILQGPPPDEDSFKALIEEAKDVSRVVSEGA